MSSTSATDLGSDPHPNQSNSVVDSAEGATANHDLPARTDVKDDIQEQNTETDDAATMAASEELRHTTLSDRVNLSAQGEGAEPGSAPLEADKDMGEHVRSSTPEHDELKERLSSPKKKRGREFEDDVRDMGEADAGENGSATAGGVVNTSRTSRSEPEKKRPRDTSEETKTAAREAATLKVSLGHCSVQSDSGSLRIAPQETSTAISLDPKKASAEPDASSDSSRAAKSVFGSGFSDKPQTSSSAFLSSGFGALSSSTTSPFGSIAASKPSVFGGGAHTTPSGFGSFAGAKQPSTGSEATSVLGTNATKPSTGFAFGSGASTSGFGGLGSGSAFGSALGNGFCWRVWPKALELCRPPWKRIGGVCQTR